MLTSCCRGVYEDSHFDWNEHVTKLLSSYHVVLTVLKKMRGLAPFKVRMCQ